MRTMTIAPLLLLSLLVVGCPESLPGSASGLPDSEDALSESESDLGGGADLESTEDPDEPDADSATDIAVGPTASIGECEPQVVWFRQPNVYNFLYGDAGLVLSPNQQVVALQSGFSREYFRVRDGEPLGREQENLANLSAQQWEYDVLLGQEAVTVVHLPTGEQGPVLTPPVPSKPELDWLSGLYAAVSPDGQYVAALSCWQVVGPGPSETSVAIWKRESGQLLHNVVLEGDGECQNGYWLDRPRIVFGGAAQVLVQPLGSGHLHLVDISGSNASGFDLVGDLQPAEPTTGEPPVYVPLLSPIADLDLSGDGQELAAVLHDGNLRFYKLHNMQQFGPTIPAGFAGINLMTYGPSTAAPVAWSTDKSVVAHMSPAGGVAISRVADGELLHELPNPEAESAGAGENFINPPVAFRFIDNDSGLLVVHEMGMQLWHCGVPEWPEVAELSLQLEGPESVVQGDQATFLFEYPPLPGPVVHSLINQEGVAYASSLAPTITTHLYGAPDSTAVTGRIESGTAQGESAPVQVIVEPGEW